MISCPLAGAWRLGLALSGLAIVRPASATTATETAVAAPLSDGERERMRNRLLETITRHLDAIAPALDHLKGKSADGMTALAYSMAYEVTREPRYHAAAVKLADRILTDMRATRFGVLYIKEKEKESGEMIGGGGPPALGWYAAAVLRALRDEPGRAADLAYIGRVLDQFPYHEKGWWAATIDIRTGEPKQPLAKPSPINKNAALAMAAGLAAKVLDTGEPALAARLRGKVERCVFAQIIPVQESDGFWHYNLDGNDPRDKDVLGYFMLTAGALAELRGYGNFSGHGALDGAIARAGAFSASVILPMTPPNRGTSNSPRLTPGTPQRFTLPADLKRAFQLAAVLVAAGRVAEAAPVLLAALDHFPVGNKGMDGAHAAYTAAFVHHLLARDGTTAGPAGGP